VVRGNEGLVAAYGATAGLVSIASMPLWVAVGKRVPKKSIYIASCLGFSLVTLSWLAAGPHETAVTLAVRGAAAGLFSGGLLLMGQSMLPDAIDYDCRRSGERREGIYSGAYSFVEKASMAIGPLLVGAILQSFGFVAKSGMAQTAEAVDGIIIGAAVLPAACYALSVIPLLAYRLDERRPPIAQPAE
jgi:GPH family glycoside/pentoside/hexuronide:cation symporter